MPTSTPQAPGVRSRVLALAAAVVARLANCPAHMRLGPCYSCGRYYTLETAGPLDDDNCSDCAPQYADSPHLAFRLAAAAGTLKSMPPVDRARQQAYIQAMQPCRAAVFAAQEANTLPCEACGLPRATDADCQYCRAPRPMTGA